LPRTRKQYRSPVTEELIGARLRQLRQQRGLTQREVAEQLEVKQALISQYERGSVRLHGALIAGLPRSSRLRPTTCSVSKPVPRMATPPTAASCGASRSSTTLGSGQARPAEESGHVPQRRRHRLITTRRRHHGTRRPQREIPELTKGHWHFVRELGHGGQSTVYKVRSKEAQEGRTKLLDQIGYLVKAISAAVSDPTRMPPSSPML